MNRNIRSRIYPIVLIIAVFLVWQYRSSRDLKEVKIEGVTMGTITYHITYLDKEGRNLKANVDSILKDFNQSLSTYVPDSEISRFNSNGKVDFEYVYFPEVLKASELVYLKTNRAFDPTIGRLVDAWGFGADGFIGPDSSQVDSLLDYTGFKKIEFDGQSVRTLKAGVELNFSAIAKGQAVDVVGNYLLSEGIENYLVEIGGEVRSLGHNKEEKLWTVGIELPDENRMGDLFDAVMLEDEGMATSGNYRNFRMVNGRKVAHTIDPATGYPKMQTLLSATVLAPNCMLADAYATACMVMGLEKSQELIESDPDLEAYLIYSGEEGQMLTYISPGLKDRTINAIQSMD